ncbi:MAG: hypothetical protein LKH33_09820 [Acetobacter sp.]|jgi:ElaB/YqjD/DUF883 family membrane-anchored ribosome-binding protein|nr:hypothetical protein [Acetobacter sp.]MCH4061872.1 hypothetical protein [Acetobacter sp.]MCH4089279.1 hypothetical protein [Acetobacter sp.]MCI1294489.1 hypothetical protein [Acetobacter sp.]MCI1321225.1 hypothetical protein [Acetobacter sp.]
MSAEKISENFLESLTETTTSIRKELDVIKEQLEKFVSQSVIPELDHATSKATDAVASARELADNQARNVSTRIISQPLMSIAVSAVIGFIAGRLSR